MIQIARSDADILKCRDVLMALRPHLTGETFLDAVHRTLNDNRMLVFMEENGIAQSAAIFEWGYNLYRGRYLYIDDLTTLPQSRGKGYASQLLDWILSYARENNFDQVHLDSGVNDGRFDAHRLYHNKRFNVTSLHFALKVKK